MKVLVTGSAGFIGSAVRDELAARGHEMIPFDTAHGNVLDHMSLWTAIAQADAVINLAGRLGTSETFGEERDTAAVNIIGALNVADACQHFEIPMVQIGTGHKGQPNPYAITKACAEDLLLGRAKVTGQPITVVRAYHAYGPGQKAYPPHGTSAVRKIIPSFVCRALTGLPLEVTGNGTQVVDLVHVREVARVLVDSIGQRVGEVVEAGTGQGMTVTDVAKTVIEYCRSRSSIVYVPMRQGEPEHSEVVATFPACSHPFPFGLTETVAYYRKLVTK